MRVLETAKDPYLSYCPPLNTRVEQRPNRHEDTPTHCLAYADDLKVVSKSADGVLAHHQVVQEFLQICCLQANPSTCAVLAPKKVGRTLATMDQGILLHGEKLPQLSISEAYQYLGLADSLSPKDKQQRVHVAGVVRKAKQDTFKIFNSCLTPQQKLDAFRVLIISRFVCHVRHSNPPIGLLKGFDTFLRVEVNFSLRLGRGAAVSYFHRQCGGVWQASPCHWLCAATEASAADISMIGCDMVVEPMTLCLLKRLTAMCQALAGRVLWFARLN